MSETRYRRLMCSLSREVASAAPDDDPYRQLATDYDWLVTDELRDGTLLHAHFAAVLGELPAGSPVLDCACGTGWNVLALARDGFEVTGSDASRAMLERARANAKAAGLDPSFVAARWEELPRRFGERFSVVACLGNSLVHAGGASALPRVLTAMRAVLQPGGWLLLDGRDFETGWRPGRRIEVPEQFESRAGSRCLPIRIWDAPAEFDAPHRLQILFVFESAGRVDSRVYDLRYRPFRRGELQLALEEAGFTDATIRCADGWLTATARR